jgi:fructose-bisphosphate aldolase class 1
MEARLQADPRTAARIATGSLAELEPVALEATRAAAIACQRWIGHGDCRRFRELLFTAPGAPDHISGVILYDETLRQTASDGTPFPQLFAARGLIPGIKVDTGAKPLAGAEGESITEGLGGLRERLAEYRALGARFAQWRAVLTIGERRPSRYCLSTNAHALARYAALCQEASICSPKPSPTRSKRRSSTNPSTTPASLDATGAPSPPMSRSAPTCVT